MLEDARNGSIDALGALGDVRELPADVTEAQITELAGGVTAQIADAHEGRNGMGYDVGKSLVLLNVWHQEHARWDPVLELLGDDAVMATHKRGALRALCDHADRLPVDVRDRLAPAALALAGQPIEEGDRAADDYPLAHDQRAVTREAALLAAALGAFNEHQAAGKLMSLLAGATHDRVRALAVADRLGARDHVGLLIALTTDAHPDIRAWAAALLAHHADRDDASAFVVQALRAAARDPGVAVAEAIAATLHDPQTDACRRLRESLREHCSAIARRHARSD